LVSLFGARAHYAHVINKQIGCIRSAARANAFGVLLFHMTKMRRVGAVLLEKKQ